MRGLAMVISDQVDDIKFHFSEGLAGSASDGAWSCEWYGECGLNASSTRCYDVDDIR